MSKVKVNDMTKAEIANYALTHFGETVNRKRSRGDVIKEFKKIEKDFVHDQKLKEDAKKKAGDKKKKDHETVLEKIGESQSEENVNYPVILGGKEDGREDRTMYKPNPTGICLGDPPNRQVVDGVAITNSNPKLKNEDNV